MHKVGSGTRQLFCRVTSEEKLDFAQRAAEAQAKADAEKSRLKSITSDIKGEIEELDAEKRRMLRIIETGQERRDVEVHQYADYAAALMRWIRTDTGEEVDSRPMTGKEMQQRFQFDADAHEQAASTRFSGIGDDEPEPGGESDA